jgi:hypothetical protein
MTASDALAERERQTLELREILDTPLDESASIHMTVKEMRWLLKWHCDFVRLLTLIEVRRNGVRVERSTRGRKKKRAGGTA